MSHHYICDGCFKKAWPIEELSLGTLSTELLPCPYCGSKTPKNTMHPLRGAEPDPRILTRLDDAYFRDLRATKD